MELLPRTDGFMQDIEQFFDNIKWSNKHYVMHADVEEYETYYLISIDLAGCKKEDIRISLQNNYLHISVTKHYTSNKKDYKKHISKERMYGSFQRSFYVGDINEEDLDASFEDGVLYIKVHKKEIEKRTQRTIQIK